MDRFSSVLPPITERLSPPPAAPESILSPVTALAFVISSTCSDGLAVLAGTTVSGDCTVTVTVVVV